MIKDSNSVNETSASSTAQKQKWFRRTEFALLTGVGTLLGVLLFAHGNVSIGPLRAGLSLEPTVSGGTVIELGPLGQIGFKSHTGVVRVVIDIHSMAPSSAGELVNDGVDQLAVSASSDLRAGFRKVAGFAVLGSSATAFVLVFIAFRRFRTAAWAALWSLGLTFGAAGSAYLTYQPNAIQQPQYRGLVSAAPSLIGSAQDIAENFDEYRDQMGRLLANVTNLYTTGSSLPVVDVDADTVTVLHVTDIHLNPQAWDMIRRLVKDFEVDVVADTGDISDHGTSAEDRFLDPIGTLGVPYVYIRGNHDSNHTADVIAGFTNAVVIDNEIAEIAGIRFAGVGDPRFTPDKTTVATDAMVTASAQGLVEVVRAAGKRGERVDIVLIHDPAPADLFDGIAGTVFAGHVHRRSTTVLPSGTRVMVEGSTGGSGLRAVSDGTPDPLQASLVHISTRTGAVVAWDSVTMSGLGLASVEISRHLP